MEEEIKVEPKIVSTGLKKSKKKRKRRRNEAIMPCNRAHLTDQEKMEEPEKPKFEFLQAVDTSERDLELGRPVGLDNLGVIQSKSYTGQVKEKKTLTRA